jgi:hypothetical protein
LLQHFGQAELPLHPGKAPRWLFTRMTKLTREISRIILDEYGSLELLMRLSDPNWFQGLSCAIGFDWHSSGTTTTTCGALKIALNSIKDSSSQIFVAGGKGRYSKRTPAELKMINKHLDTDFSDREISDFVRISKLCAKVDNSVIQDTFQLYHHSFFIDNESNYAIIQQGMNNRWARRYHWIASDITNHQNYSFSEDPRDLIACDHIINNVLDLTATLSSETRSCILDLINDHPYHLRQFVNSRKNQKSIPLDYFIKPDSLKIQIEPIKIALPARHYILPFDLRESEFQTLLTAYEQQPQNFDELLEIPGIGAKKLRALTFVSELIYGTQASWKDPVKYSFTHGGKDGIPFPVDRKTYDSTIQTLKTAIDNAKLSRKDQLFALRKLAKFAEDLHPLKNRGE